MINLEFFIESLKISWIRRLLNTSDSPWANLFESTISTNKNIFELGSRNTEKLSNKTTNMFWKDTLNAWTHFCNLNSPKGAVTLRVRGPAFGCVQNTQLNVSERISTRVQRTRTQKTQENAVNVSPTRR